MYFGQFRNWFAGLLVAFTSVTLQAVILPPDQRLPLVCPAIWLLSVLMVYAVSTVRSFKQAEQYLFALAGTGSVALFLMMQFLFLTQAGTDLYPDYGIPRQDLAYILVVLGSSILLPTVHSYLKAKGRLTGLPLADSGFTAAGIAVQYSTLILSLVAAIGFQLDRVEIGLGLLGLLALLTTLGARKNNNFASMPAIILGLFSVFVFRNNSGVLSDLVALASTLGIVAAISFLRWEKTSHHSFYFGFVGLIISLVASLSSLHLVHEIVVNPYHSTLTAIICALMASRAFLKLSGGFDPLVPNSLVRLLPTTFVSVVFGIATLFYASFIEAQTTLIPAGVFTLILAGAWLLRIKIAKTLSDAFYSLIFILPVFNLIALLRYGVQLHEVITFSLAVWILITLGFWAFKKTSIAREATTLLVFGAFAQVCVQAALPNANWVSTFVVVLLGLLMGLHQRLIAKTDSNGTSGLSHLAFLSMISLLLTPVYFNPMVLPFAFTIYAALVGVSLLCAGFPWRSQLHRCTWLLPLSDDPDDRWLPLRSALQTVSRTA